HFVLCEYPGYFSCHHSYIFIRSLFRGSSSDNNIKFFFLKYVLERCRAVFYKFIKPVIVLHSTIIRKNNACVFTHSLSLLFIFYPLLYFIAYFDTRSKKTRLI